MAVTSFLPTGIPASIQNLIQQNALTRVVGETLRPMARYREDARREKQGAGIGATSTFMRLGLLDVDLKPSAALGAPDYGQFEVEQYTARPVPYSKSLKMDALTAYGQVGNYPMQIVTRLTEWAARTSTRVCRGRFMAYLGGQSIIRRAQITSDSVLLVNSLAGFRFKYVNGIGTAVSAANPIPVTIKAGTTITNLSVTGVTPINANYPDGPGELTLSGTFGAVIAVQSYVFVQGADVNTPQIFIVRPSARVSTEALTATDYPTLRDVLKMKAKLVGGGVGRHPDGSYHLHVDETFLQLISADTEWRQAFQGAGLNPVLGAGSFFMPQHGITVIENNDSPARGRGKEIAVGSVGSSGQGGVGTPASSVSMQDTGFDVANSTGVAIRRALMTGAEVMIESYIDHRDVLKFGGANIVHTIGDTEVYDLNGMRFIAAAIQGWVLVMRPALDERAIECVVTAINYFDFVLSSDVFGAADTSDSRPYKRACWLEYGITP